MELSMWMIADALGRFSPEADIRDGSAHIVGARFLTGDSAADRRYVYALFASDTARLSLICGEDRITIGRVTDTGSVLNELFALFERCDAWKNRLNALSSPQEILDAAGELLHNPMMLSDMDGNVLAMSSAFVGEDINDYWVESRQTHRVPTAVLGAPMLTEDGAQQSWTDTTRVYIMPDGTKTIGVYVTKNGEPVAGLGLWEHDRSIRRSDIELVNAVCAVLSNTLGRDAEETPLRSGAEILTELLSGVRMDETLLERLELPCARPWRLLLIHNPYHSDATYRRNLLRRLQNAPSPCIPVLIDDYVAVLVSDGDTGRLTDIILNAEDRKYYLAVITLPFRSLSMVRNRYMQALFLLRRANGVPGVYAGDRRMLSYLLDLLAAINQSEALLHPALETLRQYDAERHTELYETLYQYLLHERAIHPGAEALHVHKNSFLYRLGRIREITGAQLDDPSERTYLLLSYLIEKQ